MFLIRAARPARERVQREFFVLLHSFYPWDSDDVSTARRDVIQSDNTYLIDRWCIAMTRQVYRDFESIVHDYWSSRDDKLVRLNIL